MKTFFSAILIIGLFITACDDDYFIDPVLSTFPAADTNITSTTARLRGAVTMVGNQKIVMYGIEIYKNTIGVPAGVSGFDTIPEVGEFTVEFTNLDPSTHYYFRAFAQINTAYIYSQNVEDFTTKASDSRK